MAEQTVNQVESQPQGDGMTLLDHLREIRNRLFKAAVALVLGTVIGLVLSQEILRFIVAPYANVDEFGKLLVTSPTEALTNVFTISLTFGAAVSMPVIVYQILAFMMPGLLPNEKRWIFLGVPLATLLFAIGAGFSWYLFLPSALGFLTNIYPTVFAYQLKPDEYVPFVMGIVFWMGVAFEMPLLIFVLAKANVVSARALSKQWRYAIVIIAIVAAVITPTPDPINMSIVMAPLLVLYVLSIGMAAIARRGKETPAFLDAVDEEKPSK
jgi:sec-independent protein translocase protein TatC